jgi:hypothetical protein
MQKCKVIKFEARNNGSGVEAALNRYLEKGWKLFSTVSVENFFYVILVKGKDESITVEVDSETLGYLRPHRPTVSNYVRGIQDVPLPEVDKPDGGMIG